MTDLDALKNRLNICMQQLESNSLVNTPKRKAALKDEIHAIELQLAQALGIHDDEDGDNGDSNDSEHDKEVIKREGASSTSESSQLPSIDSPGRTQSPSPSINNLTVIKEGSSRLKTPPILSEIPSYSNDSSSSSSSSSSTVEAALVKQEVESICSALADAGEGDMDLEALLREQEQMEQRLAALKRRREEEDEAFARSIQEEEYQAINQNSALSSLPALSSNILNYNTISQSSLDRARQEQEDAEMAKMFAKSDSATFNLITSPQKGESSSANNSHTVSNAGPLFPIFEKRQKRDPGEDISKPSAPSGFSNFEETTSASVTNPASISAIPFSRVEQTALQSHAAAILASAAGSNKKQQEEIGGKQPSIDLTKPTIDLTKQVYDISSSDDECIPVYGSNSWYTGPSSSSSSSWAANVFINYQDLQRRWYDGPDEEEDNDDEDEDEDDHGLYGYSKYNQWMHNQLYSYPQPDFNRNLTTTQTEQELRELLTNIEATEEEVAPQDRSGTPEGMAFHIALLEHQKIGLTWLQKMESGTNRGGILGDDMGLGKTIQAMALIVSRPCDPIDDPVIWDDRTIYHEPPPPSKLVKTKATLVVAPVALMYQWAEEIRTKTQPGLLKVHVYHGNGKFYDPEFLRRYDVIITTITTLANEFGNKEPNPNKCRAIGTLFKGHFHRVIIDEAHVIKNKHTKSSKACTAVAATYRWCLTGTPIQNNIDELYSLIRFLGVKPYCDWEEFRNKISTPMKKQRQYGRAMQRVQALLKAVCLRRTKASMVDGKPILNLPARNVQRVPTLFSDDERAFYVALETRTRERFNAYVKAGTVMKNYSNILVLLLRLRQACCHPHLINDFEKAMDDKTPQDKRAHTDRLLDGLLKDIRRRLIERGLDAIECPICMDVGEESVILSGCGHIYCRACITAHLSRHDEEERRCPECRRLAPIENLISVADFNARFNPTPVAEAEDPKGKGKASDDESSRHPDILPPIPVPEELETWISSSKTDKMIEIVRSVQAKGEKIIVFSQFTSLLTLMERPLRDEGIKFLRYDGAMRPEQRNEAIIRMTNDPTIPLMLISLKCGSLGLNLTIANHVVIMDPWWNPALENQAIDRVHRIGQTKEVFVHRLCIPETVEDRILALQAKKQALADGALGEGTVPKLAKLGLQELMYLFRGDV